tara:strand:- start:163 stop:966 length:804 start_codon:yes stop_codon:yes gene_type:complete
MFLKKNNNSFQKKSFNKKILLSIFLFLLQAFYFSNASDLKLAVASNIIRPIKKIVSIFEKKTEQNVIIISGSTGKLFAQISNGAPYDIFLAADEKTPKILIQKGYGLKSSEFTYAIGRLALWSKEKNLIKNSSNILIQNNFKFLSIANPKVAPYGNASVQTLKNLKIYEKLKSKIVMGENISQAFQFISSGNATLGFVALSQIFEGEIIKNGSAWVVPKEMHSEIKQNAILLKKAENSKKAQDFLSFLKSKDSTKIFEFYGYKYNLK